MIEIITATREHPTVRDYQSSRLERINYWALGLTLFIAITCALLVSDLVKWQAKRIYIEIAAAEFKKRIEAETQAAKQRIEAEARNIAARNAEIARQQEKHLADQRKRIETCQFWINEFNKTKLTGDKNHRDNACREAGMNFN